MAKTEDLLTARKDLGEICTVPDKIISVYSLEKHVWAESNSDAARKARGVAQGGQHIPGFAGAQLTHAARDRLEGAFKRVTIQRREHLGQARSEGRAHLSVEISGTWLMQEDADIGEAARNSRKTTATVHPPRGQEIAQPLLARP